MKYMKKILALALISVSLLSICLPAMAVYSTMYVSIKEGSTVRLRKTPNLKAMVYINVPHGTPVLAEHYNSDWFRVKYGEYTGYMMSKYIKSNKPNEETQPSPNNGSLPGVTGLGANSKVSAQDIRNGRGVWVKDTKTKHPQIAQMQNMLNEAIELWGLDIGHLKADGVFGEKTRYMVNAFKNSHNVKLSNVNIMDQAGLLKLEEIVKEKIK